MALLSLRRSLSEHERLQNLLVAGIEAQRATFGVLERCTLELDTEAARQLRQFLSTTAVALKQTEEPESLKIAAAGFQMEWKQYYQRSAVKLEAMREELTETVRVLQETITILESGREGNSESCMKAELSALRGLSESGDLAALRAGVQRCIATMFECLDDLRKERGSMVAHLRDEIRTLQKNLSRAEHAAATDGLTGLSNRQELERRVSNMLQTAQPFCVLYVWLSNMKSIGREEDRRLSEHIVRAFAAELAQALPKGILLGRWSDDEFCAVLDLDKLTVISLSRQLTKQLSGENAARERSKTRRIALQPRFGVLESVANESSERFLFRADRLTKAIQAGG
jgi:diguanylate cyclase (GGDEF)-like protein